MKKFISILICFSMILSCLCVNAVFAAPSVPSSEPRVSPGADWSLLEIMDFEKDSGYVLNSTIKENTDTPTGYYLENLGGTSKFFTGITNFPTLNQDSVSVKFKFYASYDWQKTEYVMISFGPAGICMYPEDFTSTVGGAVKDYSKQFCASSGDNGWGATPFLDDNSEAIEFKDGWNDIEIRLFKDTAGEDEVYTRAEYYFNGVKGKSSVQKNGLINADQRLSLTDTSSYPLAVRCGGNARSPYRVDEIYIYEKTPETKRKLSSPAPDLYENNILGFSAVDVDVKSYVARLYKDGSLLSTVTKTPEESLFVDFSSAISQNGDGEYAYSVQLKGDSQKTVSSDEVFYSGTQELTLPVSAPAKLASPPAWQVGAEDNKQILTWDSLDGASHYQLKLYKDGVGEVYTFYSIPDNSSADNNKVSVDLSEYMLKTRSGKYTAKVTGVNYIGNGEESDLSAENNYNDGLPVTVPAQPSKPQWQNNTPVLAWETVAETDSYDVKLYKMPDTTTPIATVEDITATSYDLYKFMTLKSDGKYVATVEGKNINGNGSPSEISDELDFLMEDYRNTEYICNYESPAYVSGDILSGTTDYSAVVRGEAFGSQGQYMELKHVSGEDAYSIDVPTDNADVVSVRFNIYLNSTESVKVSANSTSGGITSVDLTNTLCSPAQWHKVEIRMTKTVSGESKPYTKAEYFVDDVLVGSNDITDSRKTVDSVSFLNAAGAENTIYIDNLCADNFSENAEKDEANIDALISGMKIAEIITTDKIEFPYSANAAIDVSWSSSPSGIILNNGNVNPPAYSNTDEHPYTSVTLTATVEKGNVSKQKDFTVAVMHASVLGNLAANANRKWYSNSVFALDLREEKTFNCVVLEGLSDNVRKITLKSGDDLATLDKFTSFYTSSASVEDIISLPTNVSTRYLILEVLDASSGAVTLETMGIYNYETYASILESDLKAINLGNLNSVTSNIQLPTVGASGTSISWASDKPEIISPSGVVNRPTDDSVAVNLTATVSMEGTELTKSATFTATVLPQTQSGGGSSGSSGSLYSGGGSGISGGLAISTPVSPVTPVASNFSDTKGHWAEGYINSLKKRGIVKGDSNGNFNPESKITRAELLAMVVRALGISESGYSGQFSDVSASDWYSGAVQASLDAGLISKDVAFRPNDSITREEIAKIIVQSVSDKAQSVDDKSELAYTDKESIGSWAVEYVKTATELGLMSGMDNGSFAPKGIATRAQAAAVIERLLTLISE